MASSARIDELKQKFDENPRRYFAPLANEFRKGGDLEQAILICEEFLPQQPGHMSGHIVYGQALFESGRLDEARGVFETALSLDPENLIALRHLGDIAARQGDPTSRLAAGTSACSRRIRATRRFSRCSPDSRPMPSGARAIAPAPSFAVPPGELRAPHPRSRAAAPSQHLAPTPSGRRAGAARPRRRRLPEATPRGACAVGRRSTRRRAPADSAFRADLSVASSTRRPRRPTCMPSDRCRAEGFESTEFTRAGDATSSRRRDCESAFEEETGVHVASVPPLPGLDRPTTTIDESRDSRRRGVPGARRAAGEDEATCSRRMAIRSAHRRLHRRRVATTRSRPGHAVTRRADAHRVADFDSRSVADGRRAR